LKISATEAYVKAVTVHGENHGDDIVSAISVSLEFAMLPRMLRQFSEALFDLLFDPNQIPRIPELGVMHWKSTYDKATFYLGEHEYKPCDVKKLTFAAREGFLIDVTLNVKVSKPTAEQRGQLSGFVKQEGVKFTLESMQLRVDEPDEEEDEDAPDDRQGTLPATTDGQPIAPLIGQDGKTQAEREAEKVH
jgi:hypothetical protein